MQTKYLTLMDHFKQEIIDKTNQSCYDSCSYLWNRFPYPQSLPSFVNKYYKTSLGNKVLDVGSGTGVFAKWLADHGYDVLCIDPSPVMTRHCRTKGLKTEQKTLQEFIPKDTFAMIFAILSLIHIPKADFPEQIKKLADALPDDGLLFLGMLEGHGEGFSEDHQYPRFFAYYTPQEIIKHMTPYFKQMDYDYIKNNSLGYMLFAFKKHKQGI